MGRLGNLKWVTAVVIAVTISAAVGVAAWRASGGSPRNGARSPSEGQEMQMEAGPEGKRHEH